ncbi:hypothetical protein ES703_48695 [subsurface metagenome]
MNEIVAQSSSVARLYPEAGTIIEMGGEDSKLIFMEHKDGVSSLADFAMNNICAAGTGSFLDQQAKRIGVSIEDEFGRLALKSENPPRIAGRCSVFAKSDMIHLQQIATPVHDIVAGLCFAVARNFKSNLARGKALKAPVVFQGGVAANVGMVRAFREILKLQGKELIIPRYHASMGAIGALFHILDHPPEEEGLKSFEGTRELHNYISLEQRNSDHLEPLARPTTHYWKEVVPCREEIEEVYLGLDVGSLSTNVVLINDGNEVVARQYLPTAGKPLEAIRKGLAEIYEEVGKRVMVKGAGATGSGRYLTGDFIGADTIRNEIIAQATAAIAIDPSVDTIFEIGGQDSKFISIDNGVIVDFEMNKVCAAGTGSFLEEQAEKLDINIVQEFGDLALKARKPARLGDRCTVFMESDLNSHQQKGVNKEDLVGGLAYSIVHNYLQKVVGNKRIGEKIFFQGGVTNNRAVVAAFEKVTGKPILVPPHFDVTGAIGVAMLAKEAVCGKSKTRFKGFDISQIPYSLDSFTCRGCSNECEIRRVRIVGEKKPLCYGGRCEKYEVEERKGRGQGIPNLFEERNRLLMGDYREEPEDGRITVGIPRGLMVYYQQFPFWRTFFRELGFRVVLSGPSNRQLVTNSLERLVAETCFPVEVMHGHVQELPARNVDYIFIPFVVNARAGRENPTVNYNCPWIQSYPFMIRGAMHGEKDEEKLLIPTLHFRYSDRLLYGEMSAFMKEKFAIPKGKVVRAMKISDRAQRAFEKRVSALGDEVLSRLPEDKIPLVILGRPYNTGDPELNLRLVEKFINLNVLPIPLDFLPLEKENIFDEYPMMYWPNGQKVIAASRIIAKDERLHAVYLSNFRCGPDSFLFHYVREEMKGKPYLQLEVDEHSADAGMITRCEAFLDSLKGSFQVKKRKIFTPYVRISPAGKDRVLYFPYMCDDAYPITAAARNCGVQAESLPMQDQRDLELGRMYTSSRECFPMICTTGSMLKKIEHPGFNPKEASFFMPAHGGPCRFGQYRKLQRIILDRLGYGDVEIVSPTNEDAYSELSGDRSKRFWLIAWRGVVAVDLLRKLKQERKPYEKEPGRTELVYRHWLGEVVRSVESGARDLILVLREAANEFQKIELVDGQRKPVVLVVGEIFMRDNPFCSGFLVQKLEELGAETLIAPLHEWLAYSAYRYARESIWKGDLKGLLRSRIMGFVQELTSRRLADAVKEAAEMERTVQVEKMLERCGAYIHRHYDGDPPIALGSAAALAAGGLSGVANILPFTCLPGTLISSVSGVFRQDHDNIPWVDIAYDGQEDTGIETRLQAFMHQAFEFARVHGFDKPRIWR